MLSLIPWPAGELVGGMLPQVEADLQIIASAYHQDEINAARSR